MGSLMVPSSGSVYLDANGFIYSVERIEPYYSILRPLWEVASKQQIMIISSELVRIETLVKPLRVGDMTLVNLFRALFRSREVRLIPATAELWDRAAHLRASIPGLKTPDALHAATALSQNSGLFVTNDPRFRQVSDLPITLLSDCLI